MSAAVHTRATAHLFEAQVSPLPLASILAGLARQSELAAPAKVVRAAAGGEGLLAEIPAEADQCEQLALDALLAAHRWLEDGSSAPPGSSRVMRARIEEALDALGWRWEAAGETLRLDAAPGLTGRVLVDGLGEQTVRIAQSPLAIRAREGASALALRLFALETNARLRMVRLGVRRTHPEVLEITREVVVRAGVCLERWLDEAVQALAVAHAETGRSLRALATPAVAAVYLDGRCDGAAHRCNDLPAPWPAETDKEDRACTQPQSARAAS